MAQADKNSAIVVGSGPNGFAAAITLARAGLKVKLVEARDTLGGGVRSGEITAPGFLHDICSAVYPMAPLSPFFRSLPLEPLGLQWIHPPAAFAHPLDGGRCAVLPGRGDELSLPGGDSVMWQHLFAPFSKCGADIFSDMLGPLSLFPAHPIAMARFGLLACSSAQAIADRFETEEGRALFAGLAGHSLLAFEAPFSSASALALGLAAHVGGWPIASHGAQSITDALASHFKSLGGSIEVGVNVTSSDALPADSLVMLDISAKQFARLYESKLPAAYLEKLRRFRLGPGVFKIDWALSNPVPWQNEACRSAGTIHIGGSYEEIALSEREVSEGRVPEKPFVLACQPSLFDPNRAPPGKHTFWGYCHVPAGSTADMTEKIENQIERFAPGFRKCILAKKITTPAELEKYNANYSGGDISAGAMDWPQIFKRPARWFRPYATPIPNVFLCSASTPPGPGVHGMSGFHAAQLALRATQRA